MSETVLDIMTLGVQKGFVYHLIQLNTKSRCVSSPEMQLILISPANIWVWVTKNVVGALSDSTSHLNGSLIRGFTIQYKTFHFFLEGIYKNLTSRGISPLSFVPCSAGMSGGVGQGTL